MEAHFRQIVACYLTGFRIEKLNPAVGPKREIGIIALKESPRELALIQTAHIDIAQTCFANNFPVSMKYNPYTAQVISLEKGIK